MQIIKTKGNQNLMNREKTLFLCSKMTPIGLYDYVFKWTDSLTGKDCIALCSCSKRENPKKKHIHLMKSVSNSQMPINHGARKMTNYLLLYIMKTEASKSLCLYLNVMKEQFVQEFRN